MSKKPCSVCENALQTYKGACYKNPYNATCHDCEKIKVYEARLKSRHKYEAGNVITSVQELEEEFKSVGFVYMHGNIKHAGWVMSMQYRSVMFMLRSRSFRRAIKIK